MRKKIVVSLLMALVLVQPSTTPAAVVVGGATELTQLLNNIQLGASLVEQAAAVKHLIDQYKTMLKNLEAMTPNSTLDSAVRKLWNDQNMRAVFSDLKKVIANGKSLAYNSGNIDALFKRNNPGYGNYGNQDYNRSYKDWSDNTLSAVQGATRSVVSQTEDLQSEAAMIDALANSSQSAGGALSAIQAGNAISVAMVNQMQKLRSLQMAQMQSQNAYASGKQNQESAQKEKVDTWIKNMKDAKPIAPTNKKDWIK